MHKYNISRVTRSKKSARAIYDRLSHWYDFIAWGEFEHIKSGLQLLDVDTGEYILEIGSGTGRAILPLARSGGKTSKVVGVDISKRMTQVAESKVTKHNLNHRIQFILGDGSALPCIPGLFDAIFMSFTLELFDTSEIPIVLQECRNALRKNGRITVVSLSSRTTDKITVKLYEWLHTKMPALIDCRPIPLEEFLRNSGFYVTGKLEKSMWGLPVDIISALKT